MAHIDPLLLRNRDFAATGAWERVPIVSREGVYVLTCLDPRVDPAAFFQLNLGDACVMRNAGGRVNSEVLADLAYIGYLTDQEFKVTPDFEVAVVHHTLCGRGFLGCDEFRRGFAHLIGRDEAQVAALAVVHPEETVRVDVEKLRVATDILPATITVSGHVYDVATGLVTTVIPAAAMHADAAARAESA